MAVLGDSEAIRFASQISEFLRANDFKGLGDGISQGAFTGPVNGLILRDDGNHWTLIVGSNLPD